jgi:hypothetical protein
VVALRRLFICAGIDPGDATGISFCLFQLADVIRVEVTGRA